MLRMFSTPVFPFWINRATTPATRGADMLVPDARIVPPPFFKVSMPTEETPQVEVAVSESSPGAEIVIPIFVVGSNFPSVVYQEAVLATIADCNLQEVVPFNAVVLPMAKTSGYVAGTRDGTPTAGVITDGIDDNDAEIIQLLDRRPIRAIVVDSTCTAETHIDYFDVWRNQIPVGVDPVQSCDDTGISACARGIENLHAVRFGIGSNADDSDRIV